MEYVVIQESRAGEIHVIPADRCRLTFVAKKETINVRIDGDPVIRVVSPAEQGSVKTFDSLLLALDYASQRRDKESQPTPEVE